MNTPHLFVSLTLAALVAACGDPAPDEASGRTAPPSAATGLTEPDAADAPQPETPAPMPPPSASAGAPAAALVVTRAQIAAERSAQLETCLASGDAARGATPAMAACIEAELQAQDARLNAAYRAAMERLEPAGQNRLRAEERAWIRQRDAGCREQATGGTIDRIQIPSCVLDETIRRRLVLEATER